MIPARLIPMLWRDGPRLTYTGDVAVPATVLGMEFTAPDNRMHFTAPDSQMHFIAPDNRMHFEAREED